jgi:hypothetical protein
MDGLEKTSPQNKANFKGRLRLVVEPTYVRLMSSTGDEYVWISIPEKEYLFKEYSFIDMVVQTREGRIGERDTAMLLVVEGTEIRLRIEI